jgi:hypothetical protein
VPTSEFNPLVKEAKRVLSSAIMWFLLRNWGRCKKFFFRRQCPFLQLWICKRSLTRFQGVKHCYLRLYVISLFIYIISMLQCRQ